VPWIACATLTSPFDEQNCRDRDNDDQNDSAGSHLGSLVWWSVVDEFIGGGAAVVTATASVW
jgi:hypothetical protein